MLTRLAAPHVVPLLSHFEALVALPGQVERCGSIVMLFPWCERVIGDELINARDAAEAGEGLLSALAALHDLAVLHGDVKWSNTLWMDGGDTRRLVLADFGLAQQLDVEGRATLYRGRGTERYMAPEVRDGSALSVTAAADVYSAGVALRKLPAYAVCAPLQALATQMCAEKAYARVSAAEARRIWRRRVVPSLHQVESAAAPREPLESAAAPRKPLSVSAQMAPLREQRAVSTQPLGKAKVPKRAFGYDRTNTMARDAIAQKPKPRAGAPTVRGGEK